jgi:hypothetical protein
MRCGYYVRKAGTVCPECKGKLKRGESIKYDTIVSILMNRKEEDNKKAAKK